MPEWVGRGLDASIAERLEAAGIEDEAALVAWLAKHPGGTEAIGRVMVAELRACLGVDAAPPAHDPHARAVAQAARIPGAADLI